eukprot:c13764_g1_i1.p1 GENE.c13764_g1_i1~~c13764_g1_i1.p1  ORF type:complete len:549 (+),score=193.31 c13764_g1_i1:36-1649(+)
MKMFCLIVTLFVAVDALPKRHRHNSQQLLVPLEDGPMTFASKKSHSIADEQSLASVSTQQKKNVNTNVNEMPSNLIISTRSNSFINSLPHITGANCHVSIVRPLSDCPSKCNLRGVCGEGKKGDNPGECQCFENWSGHDCSQISSIFQQKEQEYAQKLSVSEEPKEQMFEKEIENQNKTNNKNNDNNNESTNQSYYPKVKFCYFTLNTNFSSINPFKDNSNNFFDYTLYDEPSPQLSKTLSVFENNKKIPEEIFNQKKSFNNSAIAPQMLVQDLRLIALKSEVLSKENKKKEDDDDDDNEAPPPPPLPSSSSSEQIDNSEDNEEDQVPNTIRMFGDLGTYQTSTCAIWRRGGPNYSPVQGFSIVPLKMASSEGLINIEIGGKLYCSDILKVGKVSKTGKGYASLQWLLLHSEDGTNLKYRTLAQGKQVVLDGQCLGMGEFEGIDVYAHIPNYSPSVGYVALWMKVDFLGDDNNNTSDYVTICDDFKYKFTALPVNGTLSTFSGETDCSNKGSIRDDCEAANDPVVTLKMKSVVQNQK